MSPATKGTNPRIGKGFWGSLPTVVKGIAAIVVGVATIATVLSKMIPWLNKDTRNVRAVQFNFLSSLPPRDLVGYLSWKGYEKEDSPRIGDGRGLSAQGRSPGQSAAYWPLSGRETLEYSLKDARIEWEFSAECENGHFTKGVELRLRFTNKTNETDYLFISFGVDNHSDNDKLIAYVKNSRDIRMTQELPAYFDTVVHVAIIMDDAASGGATLKVTPDPLSAAQTESQRPIDLGFALSKYRLDEVRVRVDDKQGNPTVFLRSFRLDGKRS